jgi:uncharacterized spore protein YtfJ
MESPAPFAPLGEALQRGLDIKLVYGEPVVRDDRTVIPVAKVAYVFGGGGGQGPVARPGDGDLAPGHPKGQGAGGGGAVRMSPVGALEITGDDTRFVPLMPAAPMLAVAAAAVFAGGWLVGRFRR